MKRGYKLHDGDQVPTRLTTVAEIIRHPKFARGVADRRAGRGYPADYDAWEDTNDRWAYERGRQWATVAPRHVALMFNGKVTQAAKDYYGHEIL